MSWYTTYFIGYRTKENKIYPLGPFDCNGELKCVFSHSRSFASDLNEDFHPIRPEQVTDEFRKAFDLTDEDCDPNLDRLLYMNWLPAKELEGSSDYIRTGYFLIDDIHRYKEEHDEDVFYDSMSAEEYAMRMEAELKFGPPKPREDEYGNTYTPKSCSEYAFFAYPEYVSREYEIHLLRTALQMFDEWGRNIPEGAEYIFIETEG